MKKRYVVESFTVSEVSDDIVTKDRFNSHQHGDFPYETFGEVRKQVATSSWVDLFHGETCRKIKIDESDLEWLKRASTIGVHTGKCSKMFQEDVEEASGKYDKRHSDIFDGSKYFVRCEIVSLKYGQNGVGPYTSMSGILESLVSCTHHHSPVSDFTEELILYLLPWVNIDPSKEFRVFVNNNVVTAISQQRLYRKNKTLANIKDFSDKNKVIKEWINTIIECHRDSISKKLTHVDSYVMDIAIIDGKGYFIEINPFGKELTSGSALFHWILDERKIYEKYNNTCVYFRYTR